MLPAHLAENIRKQVLYYLQSTFSFRDQRVENAFAQFVEDLETGLFKGPWVQLRRPFRPAPEGAPIPFEINIPFHPFRHQWRAWTRLSSRDGKPQATIITTGTGSGKTECFLYPILDHCFHARQAGQKGIKAIVLYPMNALASDQEKRFAKTIWNDPVLKAAGIRVGNYTGRYDPAEPGAGKDSGAKDMGKDHGITNHAEQQVNPPDVLLTNYKMLDFLLMRPQDQNLWRFNEPGVLRYLVLDELHTYDGAQGSDVACLIRRLKERLDIARGELCVVGTSATLDNRDLPGGQRDAGADGTPDAVETGKDRLARFAGTLFQEEIPPEAVIDEDRLEVEEIVRPEASDVEIPSPEVCLPGEDEDALAYAQRQSRLWGGPVYAEPADAGQDETTGAIDRWELELGEWLKRTKLFKHLLHVFHSAELQREDPLPWAGLLERLTRLELAINAIEGEADRQAVVTSFFALVSHAREMRSGLSFPLVPTQVQLWIRELRRLGRSVAPEPRFTWLDEPLPGTKSLPVFHCSECGESGWIAMHDPGKDAAIRAHAVQGIQLIDDPTKIYSGWFGHRGMKGQYLVTISPWSEEDALEESQPGAQLEMGHLHDYLCPASLVLRKGDGPCPLTGDGRRFRVRVNNETRKLDSGAIIGNQGCPRCGSKTGLFFIGSQSATLSSVAIDEMFGSILNSDPKLLAFTDSVQDASHRAGFFSARTYHFTFRTALQHVIDEAADGGLPLREARSRLLTYWAEPKAGRPGSIKETMAALIPPDLREYQLYIDYRNDNKAYNPPETLRREIEERLAWEATSEFGLMQTHGRTMELSGSSCLGWDEELISETIQGLRERLPGIDPALFDLTDDALRIWIYGLLHRYRERGALYHHYLGSYAKRNFWGKYPFGRIETGRETYPPAGRYRPRLLVTQPQTGHEHVLAHTRGGQSPWHVVWSYRTLSRAVIPEASVLDLIRLLLETGTAAGLFMKLHQDGPRTFYAISANAALLHAGGIHLVCSESGRSLVRPPDEARFWEGARSIEYYAHHGRYQEREYTLRQRYYQDRYHKGALRRVVAREHTGLLATDERENLERSFAQNGHADDPNVLTCTSTLEMGIDIGDLSSTMLCSIPPNTVSYLQRIGRAGRATGTALIVSVVNQRPHDLFFYARPSEMLRGKVDPPGCWLDASAVLVRQYLAYCFDSATRMGILAELPRSGNQLVEDLNNPNGNIPGMMVWVTKNEDELRNRFLKRFQENIWPDTRDRFLKESSSDLLLQRIHQAAKEFDRMRSDLANARSRLQNQLKALDEEEKEARREIEQELSILKGRMNSLNRTSALEILTDHGLLPNYAFPERGVRFYGAVYNKHRRTEQEHKPVELSRPAGTALRELAPANTFYTHSRQFEIQQIAIGNPQEPMLEDWGICGNCGHMRRVEDLSQPGAAPSCPQCGHDGDEKSQLDLGQQKQFIEFPRSQALSFMEHYESLSGDRSEERERAFYQVIRSFDQTFEAPAGAVGDDKLPFGIEYRASIVMREINAGYHGQQGPGQVAFGPGQWAPETGFQVCRHCGMVVPPGEYPDAVTHRRSCQARRRFEKMRQEGRTGNPFQWEQVYLYRQLRSEAIRLLLPLTDDEDIDTLTACLYLGLRLRFEGNPAHLIVAPQILPDVATGLKKHYLVLMDAVPGGTGYLKTLYQEKDSQGREGEGIMDILRRARDVLEVCGCRRLMQQDEKDDTDGCYRCVRTYHLQYKADRISRERGIKLLAKLILAGEQRVQKEALADIKPDSLFGSVLEKKFVEALRSFVEKKQGKWEQTIIKGGQGFRFFLPESDRWWELELQAKLGLAQGVMVASQPDFLLSSDDEGIKPLVIFADGFEYHCHPTNRLADDITKRRAILETGNYHLWSITWDDLVAENQAHLMVCHAPVAQYLEKYAGAAHSDRKELPDARMVVRNGMEQLKAFIERPYAAGWIKLASFALFWPLQMLSSKRTVALTDLQAALGKWRAGGGMSSLTHLEDADWVYNDKACLSQDMVTYVAVEDVLSNRQSKVVAMARLGTSEAEVSGSDYRERWRRFLACLNLYQFCDTFKVWATSEVPIEEAVELPVAVVSTPLGEWQKIFDETTSSLRPFIGPLAAADVPVPIVEYFNDRIGDDAFAELAWVDLNLPVAVLAGDQAAFAAAWQRLGWTIVNLEELQAKGASRLIDMITANA